MGRFIVYTCVLAGFLSCLIGLLGLGGWARSRRASNERMAAATVKQLASVQADFRGNDRDGNGVQDFWTGDLAGLAALGLIDRELAMADLRPLTPLVPRPRPKGGYFYVALDGDEAGDYRQDTDGTSGNVHHLSRFGFMAIPADPDMPVIMINEGNSLWGYRSGWTRQLRWPKDEELRVRCSRFG